MNYNFFTLDHLSESRISDALSSTLKVSQSSVDVADVDGDQDRRNWEALILCDCTRASGDVSLALDIFVQERVSEQPTEANCAALFASASGTVVLYPAEERVPSAYWLVTPEGLVTRTRLLASDDEPPVYSIDAVEAAVPQLPGVPVMLLPEIIREQHVPVPLTTELVSAATQQRLANGLVLADEVGNPLYEARVDLAEWERMIRRMATGWHPAGRYPKELYQEALRARDRLELLSSSAPEPLLLLLRRAVGELDGEFRSHTEAGTPFTGVEEHGWWWHRRPVPLPWNGN
ncbi:hypothetical protein ACF1AO_13195 [Streptomyces longwoodensis]|uniref:hypothetical protein n=1 Tax=Streptomyces longwoodensis TaxID=68231 RepID=UPI00370216F1